MKNKFQQSIQRTLKFIALVSISVYLYGCDAVVDCIDNDGPIFTTDVLEPAILNQVYTQTIRAEVENEPFDDRFTYDFTIQSGALPAGISTDSSGRSFFLRGTATELGTFNFKLNVFIDDGNSAVESGLCYRNRARDFQLVVQQDNS